MDFNFSEEQEMLREMARKFADKELRPIAAEVDDMAMLRLLASEGAGIALVPPVVVKQELDSGLLEELHRIPEIRETFYAITLSRRFPNPLLRELMGPYSS